MEEGHRSSLSIHPRAIKMYQDLKQVFWWPDMKKEVNEFVLACLVCQKAKIQHQKPSGKLHKKNCPHDYSKKKKRVKLVKLRQDLQ